MPPIPLRRITALPSSTIQLLRCPARNCSTACCASCTRCSASDTAFLLASSIRSASSRICRALCWLELSFGLRELGRSATPAFLRRLVAWESCCLATTALRRASSRPVKESRSFFTASSSSPGLARRFALHRAKPRIRSSARNPTGPRPKKPQSATSKRRPR